MRNLALNVISLLIAFIPVFLFFAIVGAVAGFNSREGSVQKNLLDDLVVTQLAGQYSFEYSCAKNKTVFIYSVDKDKGNYQASLSTRIALQKFALELPDERLEEYRSIISALLGGVAGGVNLKSVLKKPASGWSWSHLKKTLIGIVGSISGYYVGYQVASNYDTNCDSTIVTQLIIRPEIWIGIERAQLLVTFLTLENLPGAAHSPSGKAIYAWDEDPAFACSSQLKALKQVLSALIDAEIDNPTSQHFEIIDRIAGLHAKVVNTAEYQTLSKLQVLKQAKQFDKFEESGSVFGDSVKQARKDWDKACLVFASPNLYE